MNDDTKVPIESTAVTYISELLELLEEVYELEGDIPISLLIDNKEHFFSIQLAQVNVEGNGAELHKELFIEADLPK